MTGSVGSLRSLLPIPARNIPSNENDLPEGEVVSCERVTGIEPAFSAWEADVLPLNYTRVSRWDPTDSSEHLPAEAIRVGGVRYRSAELRTLAPCE